MLLSAPYAYPEENRIFPSTSRSRDRGARCCALFAQLLRVQGTVLNTPYLTQATPHFGFFSNDADDDAINRWLTLVANIDGHLMPSMTLKTVAEALNREPFVFFNNTGIESLVLVNRDDESDTIEIPIDSNGTGQLLLNQRGGSHTIPHFSFADAY
ncbi:MAG: CHASE2 domain-containing protein, partial [Verrucomicrobiaceae bacterium]